jgi:hypothetical protein
MVSPRIEVFDYQMDLTYSFLRKVIMVIDIIDEIEVMEGRRFEIKKK